MITGTAGLAPRTDGHFISGDGQLINLEKKIFEDGECLLRQWILTLKYYSEVDHQHESRNTEYREQRNVPD